MISAVFFTLPSRKPKAVKRRARGRNEDKEDNKNLREAEEVVKEERENEMCQKLEEM